MAVERAKHLSSRVAQPKYGEPRPFVQCLSRSLRPFILAAVFLARSADGQSWENALAAGQLRDARPLAPTARELANCTHQVNSPDSIALTSSAATRLDYWKALGRVGVWQDVAPKKIPVDTIRLRVIGTDCGLLSPFNLILQYGNYYLRLRAGALPSEPLWLDSPGFNSVFVVKNGGALEPAMWVGGQCDSCSFSVVSARVFADSIAKTDETARKVQLDSARARAARNASERQALADAEFYNQQRQARLSATIHAQLERQRRAEDNEVQKARAVRIRRKGWSNDVTTLVIAHKIKLGMTREQVRASWGDPDAVHRTVTAYLRHEQWVYGSQYVYFENGIVTAWQD